MELCIWNLDTEHQHPAGSKIFGSDCPCSFQLEVQSSCHQQRHSQSWIVMQITHCFHMSRSIFGPTLLCWCLFQEYLQPWKLKNSFSVSACTLIETIGTTRLGTLQAQERQKDCLSSCATVHPEKQVKITVRVFCWFNEAEWNELSSNYLPNGLS